MKQIYLLLLLCLVAKTVAFGQSTSSLRSDGTILVDGNPFFPFGAYSIPWSESDASKIQALNDMIAAGFNISTIEDINSLAAQAEINNLLDIAQKSNFKMLIGVTNTSVREDPIIFNPPKKYKNHPATFGYMLTDDGDNGTRSLEYLAKLHNGVKGLDNKHLTFLTLTGFTAAGRAEANSFTSIADVSAYQCYPIGAHRESDWEESKVLAQTYLRTLGYVQSAALVNRPLVMTLQTFSWGEQSDNPRYPTVSELRNMLYTGVAAGIKGVINYDFSFDLKDNQPALWSEFKSLSKDVKSIQTLLLDGKLTRKSTSDAELVSSYWESGDTCLVVLANTTYSKSKTVSLTLPSKYAKHMVTAVSTRMPSSVTYSNGIISGALESQQVEVYKLTPGLTTGIGNFADKVHCTIHPNPVKTELTVNGNISEKASYEITSIEGITLQTGIVGNRSISIENLNAGLYLIRIMSNELQTLQRFVKEE
ncbi:MAG TPA: T9SS type A sorting domain-containing protein [Cytophagaceae bacterium]|jgi:hypothetical protein